MSKSKKPVKAYSTGGKDKKGRMVMNQYTITSSPNRKNFDYKTFFYFFLALASSIFLIFLHYKGVIVWFDSSLESEKTFIAFDLNFEDIELTHYFWSVANTLLMGVYIASLLPFSGHRNEKITLAIVIVVIIVSILSLGYLGFRLILNFDFLDEKTYISNSIIGTQFIIGNFIFLTLVFVMSFIFESEVK